MQFLYHNHYVLVLQRVDDGGHDAHLLTLRCCLVAVVDGELALVS